MTDESLLQQNDEAARVATLTQRQMAVLRLAACGLVTKEIARHVGRSQHTVNKDAENASLKLGVSGRRAGARLVIRHFYGPYERVVYETPLLAQLASEQPFIVSPASPVNDDRIAVAELPATYVPPSEIVARPHRQQLWGNPDRLSPLARLLMIPGLAFLSLAIIFTLVSAGVQASKWAEKTYPNYRKPNR